MAAGQASIVEQGARLDIHQSTDKAVIDWRSFDIAPGEYTAFHQPSSSSLTLNRVNSSDPSYIDGFLTANGNIFIVNQNGLFFGQGSSVDVGGLVATTADIGNADFMAGRLNFTASGAAQRAVVNAGTITVKDAGLAALVAPAVENRGVIQAKLGKVQLASGDSFTLDMAGDGLIKVAVAADRLPGQIVANSGLLSADGGSVTMTAAAARDLVDSLIVNKGTIQARSVGAKTGKIRIAAEGANKTGKAGGSLVANNGILDASGLNAGERGGHIEVTGDEIALLDGTVFDVSGRTGLAGTYAGLVSDHRAGSAGGEILVGGDYLGQGATQTARNLFVDNYTLFYADAVETGDAGRAIFWSDGDTAFRGNVYARGGLLGGDGGFVETSGHGSLLAQGFADLSAPLGEKGTYFLDPTNIAIYGNVTPNFVSTDGTSIDLSNLTVWYDPSDAASVTLTYTTNGMSATASGASGGNTITTSADVSASLAVGARIRMSGAGSADLASNMGANTYTIAAISGTTITTVEPLSMTYAAGTNIYRGLVSNLADKAGVATDAAQGTTSRMPLWISNGQNGLGTMNFDGVLDGDYLSASYSLPTTGYTFLTTALRNQQTSTNTSDIRPLFSAQVAAGNTGEYIGVHRDGSANPTDSLIAGWVVSSALSGLSTGAGTWAQDTAKIISAYLSDTASPNISLGSNGGSSQTATVSTSASAAGIMLGGSAQATVRRFRGNIGETMIYGGAPLSANAQALMDQYQSAKYNVALDPLAGAGTEAAEAMDATNGYSAFTTRYLERLSQSANISLQATNNITLDLKSDTLNLNSGRSLTLTAGNDILSASAGTVQVNGAGSILLAAGRDVSFTHDLDLAAAGTGTVTVRANRDILYSGSGDITTAGGAIVLNTDRDQATAAGGAIGLGSGTQLSSGGGAITLGGGLDPLTGHAQGDAQQKYGLYLNGASLNGGAGVMTLNGRGYAAAGSDNYGIYLSGASLTATGAGTVTLNGQGGGISANGSGQSGIVVDASGITTATGAISLTGSGGVTGGTCSGCRGVHLTNASIGSTSGAIGITGTGGALAGTAWGWNSGIYVNGDPLVTAINSASGAITLTGISGGGTAAEAHGLYADSNTLQVGSAASTSAVNIITDYTNAWLSGGSYVKTSGALAIKPYTSGRAMNIGSATGGLDISAAILGKLNLDLPSSIAFGDSVNTGAMNVNTSHTFTRGTSFTTSGANAITLAGPLAGTGSATFSFGGATTLNSGVTTASGGMEFLKAVTLGAGVTLSGGSASTIQFFETIDGAYDLTANAGRLIFRGAGGMTPLASLTLVTDELDLLTAGLSGTGVFSVQTRTAGTDINLNGAATGLALDAAELGRISNGWADISFGATGMTGNISAGAATWSDPLTLKTGSGGIFINGAQAMGANALLAQTGTGHITLGASGAVSGSGLMTLASGGNFINNGGAGALSATGGGRWLVYSANPASDTTGGLVANFRRFSCVYGGSCPALPGTGSGFLYSYTPVLTATPAINTITYGAAVPALAGYTYALTGYLDADAAADAVTGTLTGTTTYTAGANVGTYAINYGAGALSSAMGYAFTYASAPAALAVAQKALLVTTDSKSKNFGAADPAFTGTNTLLPADAALVSWLYAPQGYSGAVGSYTIAAAATDPNNRLANYLRTNAYGTLTVSGSSFVLPQVIETPPVILPQETSFGTTHATRSGHAESAPTTYAGVPLSLAAAENSVFSIAGLPLSITPELKNMLKLGENFFIAPDAEKRQD